MKIFNWNVSSINPFVKKGVDWIISQEPDVICLQEVPRPLLEKLKSTATPAFEIHFAKDYQNQLYYNRDTFLVTLTREDSVSNHTFEYFNKEATSFVSKFLHKAISTTNEKHLGLSTVINWPRRRSKLNITNLHLSSSVGFGDRIVQLKNSLDQAKDNNLQVVCGDFNIIRDKFIKKLVGRFSGYSTDELNINEDDQFNKLIANYQLANIFSGKNTMNYVLLQPFALQLDHILINSQERNYKARVCKGFGSDHRILFIEVI